MEKLNKTLNLATLKTALELSKQVKGQPTDFVGVRGYKTQQGKISNVVILNNYSYEQYLNDCKEKLENLPFQNLPMEKEARETLLNRYNKTPENSNISEAQQNAYITIGGNFRIHKETGVVQFSGVKHSEKVLVEGEYPKRNSRQKTITQKKLEKLAGVKQWRSYNLSPEQYKGLAYRKKTLTVEM